MTWMNLLEGRVHDRILEKKKRLDALRPIPPSLLRKLRQELDIEYIYNSNAIEGNTLKLRETQLILEKGLTIEGKSLREHLEVRNHPKAIQYIEKLTEKNLTEQNILDLHQIIIKGIEKDAGRYRTGEIRIGEVEFKPPPAYEVPYLVKDLVKWHNQNPDELRPIEEAAILHHKLVHIHPFHDGNGRVARLLMNLTLIRKGYPPTTILNVDRAKYYDTLKKADDGDPSPFVNFIAAAVERSLDLYLRTLEPTEKGEELVTLREASKNSPYSQEYLSLLARKRRIPAVKIGRKWMITKKALRQYQQSLSPEEGSD